MTININLRGIYVIWSQNFLLIYTVVNANNYATSGNRIKYVYTLNVLIAIATGLL